MLGSAPLKAQKKTNTNFKKILTDELYFIRLSDFSAPSNI